MVSWIGLLEASVAGGICIILFILISPLFRERYRVKYKKAVWLLIALRLCIPISTSFFLQLFTVQMPVYVIGTRGDGQAAGNANHLPANDLAAENGDFVEGTLPENGMNNGVNKVDSPLKSRYYTSWDIIVVLWSCGSIAVLSYYLLGHVVFYRKMLQKSESCANKGILAAAARISKELRLRRVPQIRMIKDGQTGPFTVGVFRNIIVLPDTDYQEKDLQYIIKHELVHCADKDTLLKALFVIINAVHWFNPLVWLMKELISQDMELECDEKVLSAASKEERKEYVEVLMSWIGAERPGRPVLSTGYMHDVKFIKKRFSNIFNTQKKSGKLAVGIIVVLLVAASGMIGFEAGRTVYAKSKIEIDSGIELRTDVTGDGLFDRVRVFDNNDVLMTSVDLTTADSRQAQIVFDDDMWASSSLTCGDLSGNGAADIVLMRVSFGMHGEGTVSVLHVAEDEESKTLMWQEYSRSFIQNSSIDTDGVEQPGSFDDIVCIGATVIEENGRQQLRLIGLDLEVLDDDTVQCIDCSWREDGWYIENMRTITGYLTENKIDELLRNNTFGSE